jgi:hypothetical protein
MRGMMPWAGRRVIAEKSQMTKTDVDTHCLEERWPKAHGFNAESSADRLSGYSVKTEDAVHHETARNYFTSIDHS